MLTIIEWRLDLREKLKMTNLEDLTSSDSHVFKYVCLQPWERNDKPEPLEEQLRIYIEPPAEYTEEEPENPYDPYEPKRGVVIIPL